MATNGWDDHAVGWDANKDVRAYADMAFESLNRLIAPLMPNLSGRRVLDFGCGTGLLSQKLAPLCSEIVAVDTSAKMIDVLRGKVSNEVSKNIIPLQIKINTAVVNQRPELAEKFDLIVASSVCSFLPDYEAALRDLSQMMKQGAYFAQWDWLADMAIDRIQNAYKETGLNTIIVEEVFTLAVEGESMPVVMGLAQAPSSVFP